MRARALPVGDNERLPLLYVTFFMTWENHSPKLNSMNFDLQADITFGATKAGPFERESLKWLIGNQNFAYFFTWLLTLISHLRIESYFSAFH